MASTPIEVVGDLGTTKVILRGLAGATGTPAASYATSEVIAGVLYSATVSEALAGRFQYVTYTTNDGVTGYGVIELADDTAVHHPGDLPAQVASTADEVSKIPRGAASITAGSFKMSIGVNDAEVSYTEPA